MLKARRENFPVASCLLPRDHRRHLLSVYGFARAVDDIGDEAQTEDPLRSLDIVDADLARLYAGRAPRLPVVQALARTVAACSIPAEPFRRLIEANRQDQRVSRYGTFGDLLAYCELSANPVGHIVLQVFDMVTPRASPCPTGCAPRCRSSSTVRTSRRTTPGAASTCRRGPAPVRLHRDDLAGATTPTRLRGVVALQSRRAGRLLDEGDPLARSSDGLRPPRGGGLHGGRPGHRRRTGAGPATTSSVMPYARAARGS